MWTGRHPRTHERHFLQEYHIIVIWYYCICYFLPLFTVSRTKPVIFLLCNNLFIYQVLCTFIYRRRSLYSFLLCKIPMCMKDHIRTSEQTGKLNCHITGDSDHIDRECINMHLKQPPHTHTLYSCVWGLNIDATMAGIHFPSLSI